MEEDQNEEAHTETWTYRCLYHDALVGDCLRTRAHGPRLGAVVERLSRWDLRGHPLKRRNPHRSEAAVFRSGGGRAVGRDHGSMGHACAGVMRGEELGHGLHA